MEISITHHHITTRFVIDDAAEHIQNHLNTHKSFYELAMLDDMLNMLQQQEGCVLDIGANIGNHSLFLAMHSNRDILAFEPCTANAALLEKNAALNNAAIQLHRYALGEKAETGRVELPSTSNMGMAKVVADAEGDLPIQPLDSIALPCAPAIIKLDVEGMEYVVLRGAKQLLLAHAPVLYIEIAHTRSYDRIASFLAGYGYVSDACFNHTPTFRFRKTQPQAIADIRLATALAYRAISLMHLQQLHHRREQGEPVAYDAATGVSVILPVCNPQADWHNAAEAAHSCHESVYETLIADYTTDGLDAIPADWARRRIRVIRPPRESTRLHAVNWALAIAEGTYATLHEHESPAELAARLTPQMEKMRYLAHALAAPQTQHHACRMLWHRHAVATACGYAENDAVEESLLIRLHHLFGTETIAGELPFPQQYSLWQRLTDKTARRRHHALQRAKAAPYHRAVQHVNRPFICAGMASFPPREENLRQAVASILPQVDRLYVYLNGYENVPNFLLHPRITVGRSQQHGDLQDNGKLFFLKEMPKGYRFTLDDDIAYPPDYVERMVQRLWLYDHRVAVGVHGAILAQPLERFFHGRDVRVFWEGYDTDKTVNVLGTGTLAWHSDTLKLSLEDFPSQGMADVWFAITAKAQGVPLVCLARPKDWLHQIPLAQPEECLYERYKDSDQRQTDAARKAEPWGFDAQQPAIRHVAESLRHSSDRQLAEFGIDAAFWRHEDKNR